ncbi:MAG: hypothetical protein KGM15_08175 [Pseudomonadota bacterium]|nr:hypothetical protein [Pseudomonadota bacterium]
MSIDMGAATIFLARWLGLYLVVVALAMLAKPRRTLETFAQMTRSETAMLMAGIVATMLGLALLVAHPVWRGGGLALAVTLAGWAALLKGLWLLFAPQSVAAIYRAFGLERHFRLWMGVTLLAGLALTFAAFRAG